MNLFEFFYFGIYLSLLTIAIVAIQIYEPGKQSSESTIVEEAKEEPESDEGERAVSDTEETEPAVSNTEEYSMTENPMFRHRNVASLIEQVD